MGEIMGTVVLGKTLTTFAPSIWAASFNSQGRSASLGQPSRGLPLAYIQSSNSVHTLDRIRTCAPGSGGRYSIQLSYEGKITWQLYIEYSPFGYLRMILAVNSAVRPV